MIQFVPAHLEKVRAKTGELAKTVDVVLGNLEDAIPADAKIAARQGMIEMGQRFDFGQTGLWTRINALNSPWALDDITEIVAAIGNKLDVIMLPKVEGPWDIHYLDQLLAQLEARHGVTRPILIHAILETAEGVKNVDTIATASPRMHGMSLGPADLAASRAMKTTRVGGGHPEYKVIADPGEAGAPRASVQQDLWHYTVAKMVDACAAAGIKSFYGPFGDIADAAACEVQFRNAFLMGCAGAWSLHPSQVAIAKRVFSPGPARGGFRQEDPRRDARWLRRRDDRRQDAGRRDLETGQGDRRSCEAGRREGPRVRAGLRPVTTPTRRTRVKAPALPIAAASLIEGHDPDQAVPETMKAAQAKFAIGQIVRHRRFPFRGVIYDVDPIFANTEEWWLAIPEEVRPRKDQPFYHLYAENAETEYVAYVSEQNLLPDDTGDPLRHPQIRETFDRLDDGRLQIKRSRQH